MSSEVIAYLGVQGWREGGGGRVQYRLSTLMAYPPTIPPIHMLVVVCVCMCVWLWLCGCVKSKM
jgi:hypothetical protein